ncbi:MAG: hypothetical protein K9W45_03365 [Candidatus Heimdallarchaeum aukensis]|uniref:Uncharacterized protein n=1 Tax=Candidatus Heimdallarchaeum aukensis TaxID=2876573 RepID=A0A9Y1BMM7_9ARCH|nr:MAG: hypothetical protein K9W45_03365 [Candidatus Heimdallarchaeum aukensis]
MSDISLSLTEKDSRKQMEEEYKSQQFERLQIASEEENSINTILKNENVSTKIREITTAIPIIKYKINFLTDNIKVVHLKDKKIESEKISNEIKKYEETDEDISVEKIKPLILEYIKNKEGVKTTEIIEHFDFDTWLILESLDELKEEGMIE